MWIGDELAGYPQAEVKIPTLSQNAGEGWGTLNTSFDWTSAIGLGLGWRRDDRGVGAAFAVVAGDVVLAEQGDGEAFGADDCVCLFGSKAGDDGESADVG